MVPAPALPLALAATGVLTWYWLVVLLVLGSFGTIWAAYVLQVRRGERQRRRLERIVAERTAALQAANQALEEANGRLQQLSFTDPLTALWNRRYLADRIDRDVAQLSRLRDQGSEPDLSILFLLIDIDHFKQINDRWGHEAGDDVLVETARRLRGIARATDHVLRWGGEEFLIVACFSPAATGPRVAERVMEALWREPFRVGGDRQLRVTGSIGFSAYPLVACPDEAVAPLAHDWQRAINCADHALYFVKENGRNGWAGFVPRGSSDRGAVDGAVAGTLVHGLTAATRPETVLG